MEMEAKAENWGHADFVSYLKEIDDNATGSPVRRSNETYCKQKACLISFLMRSCMLFFCTRLL